MLPFLTTLMVFVEPLRRMQNYTFPLRPPLPFTRFSHRNHPLLPRDAQYGVVAVRSPRGGVDEDVDGLVHEHGGRLLGEHHFQVRRFKNLLTRVECEAGQLGLDEVRAVLHDGLELDVPVGGLPPVEERSQFDYASVEQSQFRDASAERSQFRDASAERRQFSDASTEHSQYERSNNSTEHTQFEASDADTYERLLNDTDSDSEIRIAPYVPDSLGHEVEAVDAVAALSLFDALITSQFDLTTSEDWEAGGFVPQLNEPGVEVDLVPQRGDPDQRGVAHEHEGSYGLLSSTDEDWQSISSEGSI